MSASALPEKFSSKINLEVEKYKLKNGLKVLLNPDNRLNIASYFLGFSVGSRHERSGRTGISHMFEHLMFKGTKKYPEFDKLMQERGVISINAFTSHDYTAYTGAFPPEELEFILEAEADRMTHLSLTQEELDKERGAVQEERLMNYVNSPSGLLFINLFDLAFKAHPYRQPIIGYEKDIAGYTLEDLNKWYQTYYSPNNAALVISGNFSVKEAKALIEKHFGPLASKKIPEEQKILEPEQIAARQRLVKKEGKLLSPRAVLAYKAPPAGNRELYALEAISSMLGSGESSLLYKKLVREKRLLSSIYSSVYSFLDQGVFLVSYSFLNPLQEKEIKKLVLEEIKKSLSQISARALERAKNMQMNEMLSYLKTSHWRARLLLDAEMKFGDYKKIYERIDLLNELSPDFIQAAGEKHLREDKLSYLVLK